MLEVRRYGFRYSSLGLFFFFLPAYKYALIFKSIVKKMFSFFFYVLLPCRFRKERRRAREKLLKTAGSKAQALEIEARAREKKLRVICAVRGATSSE